jgi:urease accessory protein
VIREDPTLNLQAIDQLMETFPGLAAILVESGGDNLASTFSSDLVDYWIFVIDTAGGDDIPRKRGPGVVRADLLVINKIDLAPLVHVDLDRMLKEARQVRDGRPVLTTNCATGEGIDELVEQLSRDVLFDR